MDGTLGNMQDTMGRVLQALASLRSAAGIEPPATSMPVPASSNSFRGTTAGISIGPPATGMPVPRSSNSFWETTTGATGGAVPDENFNEKNGNGNGEVGSGQVRNGEVENGEL